MKNILGSENGIKIQKYDVLFIGLSIFFFIVCAIHVTLIVMGKNVEQMWMLFGSIAMMLLLLSSEKNLLNIFAIVVFGTYVADEEFLLEVAAMSTGEQLASIRQSRNFEVLTVTDEVQTKATLSAKLDELMQQNTDSDKIVEILEAHRLQLEIEADLPGFEPIDKAVINIFSNYGKLEENQFFSLMQDKGFGDNEIKDSFEKLGAADYLKNNPHNLDEALLTEKGEKLKARL